jgi:uroporphyrinogen decarboxylase
MPAPVADGVHALVPRARMAPGARKLRDYYDVKPGAPIYQKEFGFYCLDRWKEQGMPQDVPHSVLFGYDLPGKVELGELGWCEAAFEPAFEVKLIEDRGQHEVVQDSAGRHVLFFKGRRSGFMPEYLTHPVKDRLTWERDVKWRLDPRTPLRYQRLSSRIEPLRAGAAVGMFLTQRVIGGYMYLRSLIGPTELPFMFHDDPELVHDCMRTWFDLADRVIACSQQHVTFDELFFGEDICYNHGPLISPAMIREFLVPYYQQLYTNMKARQIDRSRHLFFYIDTDGLATPIIPLYQSFGMDAMSPFEVASGCDVVEIGRQFPELRMNGGIDKRILAKGRDAIDRHVDYILPAMQKRGGYFPTCDHGVPEEVPYQDYLHYRKRCMEFA